MRLLAPTVLRIAPADLRRRAQERFGGELRRTGSFTQLAMLGASACLRDTSGAAAGNGPLGVLWTSVHGTLASTRAALEELRSGGPLMPFTFIATQPHYAAALLARRGEPVARSAFVYLEPGGERWLAELARAWLRQDCGRVLLGWVEESAADASMETAPHQSDWCLLAAGPAGAEPIAGSGFLRAVAGAISSSSRPA